MGVYGKKLKKVVMNNSERLNNIEKIIGGCKSKLLIYLSAIPL